MTESTMMKYEHTDHTLAVAEIYFTLNPQHFMFEPKEKFEYGGKRLTWNPDCIFVHEKKVYVCEVQRKSLGTREWRSKWEAFNLYFESAFKEAAYQDWSDKGKAILPRFIAITDNKFAAEGFDIKQRELIVMESIEQLIEK